MLKVLSSILILVFSLPTFATTVVARQWALSKSEQENIGIVISIYDSGQICGSASDIYIEAPKEYMTSQVRTASITINENEEIILFSNLIIFETSETLYSETPFHGVTFCLAPEYWDNTEIRISYGKGEFTTDELIINNIKEWKN